MKRFDTRIGFKIKSVYLLKRKKLDEAGDVQAEVFSLLHKLKVTDHFVPETQSSISRDSDRFKVSSESCSSPQDSA